MTALALVVVAGSCLAAAVLARERGVPQFVLALAVVAGALVVGAIASAGDRDAVATVLVVLTSAVVVPLALSTYPNPAWRDPATWLLATLSAGCAAVYLTAGSPEVVEAAVVAQLFGLVATGWWRLERSRGRDQQLLLWQSFVVGLAALPPATVAFATPGDGLGVTTALAAAAIAPALAAGVRRPDNDLRSLVVPTVVALLAGSAYMALVVTTWRLAPLGGVVLNEGGRGLVAFLVALLLAPASRTLRSVVDAVLFGRRPDPLVAATRAASAIGDAGDDLDAAFDAVRKALVLPSLALSIDGTDAASAGEEHGGRTVDVPAGGAPPVVLRVGLRPAEARLSPQDVDVLRVMAPLLAQTVHARRLASELHASRGRVITAVEEERRRLRRDLHDGLGPRLSGMAFTTDAARNVLAGRDPDRAAELLADVRAYAGAAVEEVRDLVAGLRPPALDELGLAGALRQHAADVRRHDGHSLAVTVAAGDLGAVSAAVEVAAFRIVVEALTNVARHTDAARVEVHLARARDHLCLSVADDGSPAGPRDRSGPTGTTGLSGSAWTPGTGLSSMTERAEALGGTVTAGPTTTGGLVEARLPCGVADPRSAGPAGAPPQL